jgi:glycogen debranching enzyme
VRIAVRLAAVLAVFAGPVVIPAQPLSSFERALAPRSAVSRDGLPASGLSLERPTRAGAFLDVVGRRSAFVGYEHRGLEAWVYPLKLLDDLRFGFRLDGYPQEIEGADVLARITARPEATILTYSHAAFTARAVLSAPFDEPALIVRLEADTTVPLAIRVSFRPRLRLMWPAGLQTGNVGWNASVHAYEITEESGRYAGVVGSPAAADASLMPYQEEPKDLPVGLTLRPESSGAGTQSATIVIAGSVKGIADARRSYERIVSSVPALITGNAEYYRRLLEETVTIDTPDDRVDTAFAWAKVGVDKGVATNPFLGTGLIAGFRTSGDSERPGFAWYFGRDALWTALAITSYGDLETARSALAFLGRFQRDDGKIPHEISQSATLIPWFTDYPYAWASADATPLFVAAQADYWRASGDRRFLEESWPAIVKAWEFSAATDGDGDALIENTGVGHGWVEGGALYPPHEEIYLQGVWVAAQDGLAELADAVKQPEVAARAREGAARTRDAIERTYWREATHEYTYATKLPRAERVLAEPGPFRERRQARLDAIADASSYEATTVLPAVPMWWRVLAAERTDGAIDALGGGALATDWGHRLLSSRSDLYDPLSYHFGSVWPLFTGWASVGAYQYGRAHVGYQALMANALLTESNALGYVTELLSGEFQAPFGRSSHHQIWSEAMVITPVVRGLLGIEVRRSPEGVPALTIAPQLPADWDDVRVRGVRVPEPAGGSARYDIHVTRREGERRFEVTRQGRGGMSHEVTVAAVLPLDAQVREVAIAGRRGIGPSITRRGDAQVASVTIAPNATTVPITVVFTVRDGTDVYRRVDAVPAGASSRGLRVLRSRADDRGLSLRLEGLAGEQYTLRVRTSRRIGELPAGVRLLPGDGSDPSVEIAFEGPPGEYVRRDVLIPLS